MIAAFLGIAIHHRIIINEEKFLAEKFGKQYKAYLSETRRYL